MTTDRLARVSEGFKSVTDLDAMRSTALAHLDNWLREPEFDTYKPQLLALIEAGKWDLLLDSFRRIIPFGTGGRRGAVGIGPNRINPWTIGTSVQGHVAYLQSQCVDEQCLHVVIAYDVRRFLDLKQRYVEGVANPLLRLTSRDLAEYAARIYVANGLQVSLQPRTDAWFMSTPELSFAIRHLEAHAGLNVSASHNPPDDNGGKFYNRHGGQEVPPNDALMARWVDKVAQVRSVTWDEAKDSGQISWLGEEVHEAYIERVASLARTQCREGMTVFTGLHGAGRWSVAPVLREAGFSVVEVEDQAEPDGMFPTVPFRAPNPEVRGCMDRAVQVAEEVGADLVMATDPDADRIGAVVRHGGSWRFLTGNEIAVLIVHHALTQGNVSRNPLVIRTEVTTSLVTRIANGLGASVVDHLLVGFKYIGDVLRQLDENGAYGHWTGSPEDFVAGVEESHGVLVSADIRDKDAAGGALFLAEASALALENGQTLVDTLETIWRSYGYVANRLISTVMQGARGSAQIARLMDDLRVNPPDRIGKRKVRKTYDRQDPKGVFGDLLSETDEAARNVLVFELQGEARIVLRPSGTEPKCKVYGEIAQSLSGDLKRSISRANRDLDEVVEDFVMLMLARLGHCVPRWALGSSDLLPLEDKIQFAQVVFPELLVRLETESNSAAEWLDAEMHSFGPDGLALVSGAVDRWLCEHEVPSNLREGLQQLFALMP